MSRWIDADALHDALKAKQMWVVRCGDKHNEGYTYDQVHFAIDDAPGIDIVRCGECKMWMSEHLCQWWSRYGTVETDADDFCSYGERSEKPNNCEHITEDGVTCAKYPACDDCLDNPLNKVKGSERLVKGSERSSE